MHHRAPPINQKLVKVHGYLQIDKTPPTSENGVDSNKQYKLYIPSTNGEKKGATLYVDKTDELPDSLRTNSFYGNSQQFSYHLKNANLQDKADFTRSKYIETQEVCHPPQGDERRLNDERRFSYTSNSRVDPSRSAEQSSHNLRKNESQQEVHLSKTKAEPFQYDSVSEDVENHDINIIIEEEVERHLERESSQVRRDPSPARNVRPPTKNFRTNSLVPESELQPQCHQPKQVSDGVNWNIPQNV